MNIRKMDSIATMNEAMKRVNARYSGNIEYYYIDPDGTGYRFRLTAIDSHGPGSKHSGSLTSTGKYRRIGVGACWHVHGLLFDILLDLAPGAYLKSAYSGRIDVDGGNWQDVNVGSHYIPMMASAACECEENDINWDINWETSP